MSTETSAKGAFPQVQFRTVAGVRIRFADSGGTKQPTLLLTCPWPESVYAFEPMWARWPSTPACSRSTCRASAHHSAATNCCRLMAMGEFLAELIVDADLGRLYIVGPDVGTAAALFCGCGPRADQRRHRRDRRRGDSAPAGRAAEVVGA